MLLLDLRMPFNHSAAYHASEENPLVVLRSLNSRAKAVMMAFSHDFQTHRFTCLAYCPDEGTWANADAGTPEQAFELAQAQYQQDTGPAKALQ